MAKPKNPRLNSNSIQKSKPKTPGKAKSQFPVTPPKVSNKVAKPKQFKSITHTTGDRSIKFKKGATVNVSKSYKNTSVTSGKGPFKKTTKITTGKGFVAGTASGKGVKVKDVKFSVARGRKIGATQNTVISGGGTRLKAQIHDESGHGSNRSVIERQGKGIVSTKQVAKSRNLIGQARVAAVRMNSAKKVSDHMKGIPGSSPTQVTPKSEVVTPTGQHKVSGGMADPRPSGKESFPAMRPIASMKPLRNLRGKR